MDILIIAVSFIALVICMKKIYEYGLHRLYENLDSAAVSRNCWIGSFIANVVVFTTWGVLGAF